MKMLEISWISNVSNSWSGCTMVPKPPNTAPARARPNQLHSSWRRASPQHLLWFVDGDFSITIGVLTNANENYSHGICLTSFLKVDAFFASVEKLIIPEVNSSSNKCPHQDETLFARICRIHASICLAQIPVVWKSFKFGRVPGRFQCMDCFLKLWRQAPHDGLRNYWVHASGWWQNLKGTPCLKVHGRHHSQ